MAPEQVGRYQLLEPLGQGAIAEVYRALDPHLNRQVAIKIISRMGMVGSDEMQRRFRREVQLAAYLNHPHIITVYDVGVDHDPPYLVTELLTGGTFQSFLKNKQLSWAEALGLLQPICQALAYAHEAGIVHRDVKPGNIMLTSETNAVLKLADFGLAQRIEADQLTQQGGIVGTIAYMSPEQANGERVDARTDIFSLGLILFEAIVGTNPLRGETVSQTLAKAVSYQPLDLSQLNGRVPAAVEAVLHKALAKERRQRYGNCHSLCRDIASCLDQAAEMADPASANLSGALVEAAETQPAVKIENPSGLSMPPNSEDILRSMFAGHLRLSIREELGGGFSGSRVFVVGPVREDGMQALPAVVKMAPIRLIEQEWQAYQIYIRDQLSGVAQILGEPVLPPTSTWGGLRYRMVGSGAIEFESLQQAYNHAPAEKLRFLLEERLFKRLGSLWRFNYPASEFHLAPSYDHLLPINLIIRPGETAAEDTIPVIRAGEESVPMLVPGDPVRLSGFVISEIEADEKAITLDWPAQYGDLGGSYRVRLQPVNELKDYQVGQIADGLEGVVTVTRMEALRSHIVETFGWDFSTEKERFLMPGGESLPNPLLRLPELLAATPTVRLANIHGDLNPENILVDLATWDIRLIDFATARRDHVLHDFLRLETGIVTRLLSETIKEANLPPRIIVDLYEQVHCASFTRPATLLPDLASQALEKPYGMLVALRSAAQTYFFDPDDAREYYQGLTLYLLGAMKYKNLDKAAKELAFWGAAAALSLLDEPPPCSKMAKEAVTVPAAYQETPPLEPVGKQDVVRDAVPEPVGAPERRMSGAPERPVSGKPIATGEKARRSWLAQNWLPVLLVSALLTILIVALVQGGNGTGADEELPVTDQPEAVVLVSPVQATDTPRPTATATLRPTFTPIPPTPTSAAMGPLVDVADQSLTVAILLDTSISMNQDQKIIRALEGVISFIDRLDPDDEVAVYTFGNDARQLQPAGRVADVREDLKQRIGSLFADGDTLLYDALCQSFEYLAESAREERLYAVILLTDGQDAGQGQVTTEEEMLACFSAAEEQVDIQTITITYGDEADADLLERFAGVSNGRAFTAFTDTILERFWTISFVGQ